MTPKELLDTMIVNLVFAAAKILGGLIGNAYVLIADGIESALDVAGSLIIWGGLKLAARPPDETHPYGHGKAEPIAAVVVAFGVLAAALGLAIESIREIRTPHHGPAPFTLGILIVVIVVKEILFRYVNRVGRNVESTAVQTDAWHHRSDALTSAAAFIGITAALVGGRGWESADDWAALFACCVIAANGVRLLRPALYEIMSKDRNHIAHGNKFLHPCSVPIGGADAPVTGCAADRFGLVRSVNTDVRFA